MKSRHTTSLIILFCFTVVYANRQLEYAQISTKLIITLLACGVFGGILLATLISAKNDRQD